MYNTTICEWLLENADTPIRYRVLRELLYREDDANALKNDLLNHLDVSRWLKNLKPETPPQHRWMIHGARDYNFENALFKIMHLGLHAGFDEVRQAAGFYLDSFQPAASLLTASMFIAAGFDDDPILKYFLEKLDLLYRFTSQNRYDIYVSDAERTKLAGIPTIWKSKKVIKPEFFNHEHNTDTFHYPLIYDLYGLYKLYEFHDPQINAKVDSVIRYIACDDYNNFIEDGYGIVIMGQNRYHGMGWDAKFPGWHNVKEYMENGNAPKLMFFAMLVSKYPVAVQTKWFKSLLEYLETYKSDQGFYCFPSEWLPEKSGYAVHGSHMSFGESRRKKNWREIESTFYMQLLLQNA